MREIALHILDLVQNAVAAGASTITIAINEDRRGDILTISVADNGCGMDNDFCRRVLDPFVTTRQTRHVGLGLPLLAMTTKQAGGYLKLTSQPGHGTAVDAVFQYSHLDRPPLGKMAETLLVIVVGNPDLDIIYCHAVDDRHFIFKLNDFKAQLVDIPVTHPEVIAWLRGFLATSLADLYGGGEIENT